MRGHDGSISNQLVEVVSERYNDLTEAATSSVNITAGANDPVPDHGKISAAQTACSCEVRLSLSCSKEEGLDHIKQRHDVTLRFSLYLLKRKGTTLNYCSNNPGSEWKFIH